MKRNLFVYKSQYKDPFVNLAIENYILGAIQKNDRAILFYENTPSIVMGRFQNPWLECDFEAIKRDNVHLVRRQSGGGTVYHDSGNVNFCYINGDRDHGKDVNNAITIDALKALNIPAYASGRSDICLEYNGPKKISGSAFKQKKDASFHHGTMLIHSELDRLNSYLNSKHTDIEAVGIKSVRSVVFNISDLNKQITKEKFISSMVNSFNSFYQGTSIESEIFFDQSYVDQLKSWTWLYGETPKFEINRTYKDGSIFLRIRKGIIEELSIENSYDSPHFQSVCSDNLVQTSLSKDTFQQSIKELKCEYNMFEQEFNDLEDFILDLFHL